MTQAALIKNLQQPQGKVDVVLDALGETKNSYPVNGLSLCT